MVTVGEVKAVLEGAPAFFAAMERILRGTADFSDAAVVGEDVLMAAVLADPELAPFTMIAQVSFSVLAALLSSGAIKPASNPIAEGQTTSTPHTGRVA